MEIQKVFRFYIYEPTTNWFPVWGWVFSPELVPNGYGKWFGGWVELEVNDRYVIDVKQDQWAAKLRSKDGGKHDGANIDYAIELGLVKIVGSDLKDVILNLPEHK